MKDKEKQIAKQKLERFLIDHEVVEWVGENRLKYQKRIAIGIISAFYVVNIFVVIVCAVFRAELDTFFFTIPYAVMLSAIFALVYFILKAQISTIYFITNKRVLFHTQFLNYVHRIPYKNIRILRIETAGHKTIAFTPENHGSKKEYSQENNLEYKIKNITSEEAQEVTSLIYRNIREEGQFSHTHKVLQQLAVDFELDYSPYGTRSEAGLQKRSSLEGIYKDMLVEINIDGVLPIKKIEIGITCPNHENNALRISSESVVKKLNKLLGAQDIQIGNKHLDESYIFQSDNKHFLDMVLTKSVRDLLHKSDQIKLKEIKFGDAENLKKERNFKSVKPKFKADETILEPV